MRRNISSISFLGYSPRQFNFWSLTICINSSLCSKCSPNSHTHTLSLFPLYTLIFNRLRGTLHKSTLILTSIKARRLLVNPVATWSSDIEMSVYTTPINVVIFPQILVRNSKEDVDVSFVCSCWLQNPPNTKTLLPSLNDILMFPSQGNRNTQWGYSTGFRKTKKYA